MALRLDIGGTRIAYTGDTAWTDAILDAAAGAHLLIAEAYYRDKPVPHHLTHAALAEHRHQLGCERVVLTHMSTDMLDHADESVFETAHDGLVLHL
nr:MBL fold metallo-hydrolase [Allosalinactinospora lopnorensis]